MTTGSGAGAGGRSSCDATDPEGVSGAGADGDAAADGGTAAGEDAADGGVLAGLEAGSEVRGVTGTGGGSMTSVSDRTTSVTALPAVATGRSSARAPRSMVMSRDASSGSGAGATGAGSAFGEDGSRPVFSNQEAANRTVANAAAAASTKAPR